MLAREKLENWSGKVFGAHWIEGRGGEVAIVEPTTGEYRANWSCNGR
jgi:hypothetical protein